MTIETVIQLALGNEVKVQRAPDDQEWRALFEVARKQAVTGICFAGVQRLHTTQPEFAPPEAVRLQWLSQAAAIQRRNEILNLRCQELQCEFSEAGFRSSILKGQGIAQLYGKNLAKLRQPGDIDIFVDCDRERAIEYAKSTGDQNPEWDYKHLHLKRFKGLEVEMHYVPEILMNLPKNRKLQHWFDENREEMFTEQDGLIIPSIRFNLFYILLHIYRHFLYEGVGLRQLIDYYFVLKKANGDYHDETVAILEEFGMIRFAKGVMWIMKTVFLLENSCLLCTPDASEGEYIFQQVMAGGNFGHYDKRLSNAPSGKIGSVCRILKHNLHLIAHYPSDVIWAPVWIVGHWCWKRITIYKNRY